jgi:hypothetical protein
MALLFPDILRHNNSNLPLTDIKEVRGTTYPIADLTATGSIPPAKRNIGTIIFASSSQEYYGFYGQTTASVDWDDPSNWRTLSTFTGNYTGSFTGSFIGDGSGLTNISASNVVGLNLTQISSGNVTASVSTGVDSFTITSGSNTFLRVKDDGTVIVEGDFVVNGDVTVINTTELFVQDQFITLASGSDLPTDGGIIVGSVDGIGMGLGYNSDIGRWVLQKDLSNTTTRINAPDAYIGTVEVADTLPVSPFYGDGSTLGAIFINDSNSEIYIWA